MSKEQKGFIVYGDIDAVIEELNDEQVGQLFRGMVKYFTEGKTPKFTGILKYVFIPIKQQMDRDNEKYTAKCEKNRENIKAYWERTKEYDRYQYKYRYKYKYKNRYRYRYNHNYKNRYKVGWWW